MSKFGLLAAGAVLAMAGAASAATLTFDDLFGTYGSGNPLGPNMVGNGQTLAYTESGFVLTLYTSNTPDNEFGAHIGDGTGVNQTFNWHDDGNNLPGAYITLTRVGGGSFKLVSFDWLSFNSEGIYPSDFSVDFGSGPILLGEGSGNYLANSNSLTSVTFTSTNYTNNGLDNIVLTTGVPEPASWAMLLAGFGAIGVAARRRQRISVNFG